MAQPGWYPDPQGSGEPRYWDGHQWVNPGGGGPKRRWGTAAIVAAGLLVVALIVTVLLWRPWSAAGWPPVGPDTNTARPTGSQWDELAPSPTPSPSESDGDGRSVDCPSNHGPSLPAQDGWYTSTGMKYQGVAGWNGDGGWTLPFTEDRTGQQSWVTSDWVSITAMGGADTSIFSQHPKQAAAQLADCMATSHYYEYLERRELIDDEEFTTSDGVRGWLQRYNYWNRAGAPVDGDVVLIVVVDSGVDGRLAVFHTQAPIGDEARLRLVEECLGTLQRA